MSARLRRRGRWAFGLTVAAFAWGLLLLVAAVVVPVYSGGSSTSDGHTTVTRSYASTLVDENGLRVLIPLAIPALLAAVVWIALHRRCSRGSRIGGHVAWLVILLLGCFTVLASMSIGAFLLPLVALLVAAATLTPDGTP
jgi:hypothetical protein